MPNAGRLPAVSLRASLGPHTASFRTLLLRVRSSADIPDFLMERLKKNDFPEIDSGLEGFQPPSCVFALLACTRVVAVRLHEAHSFASVTNCAHFCLPQMTWRFFGDNAKYIFQHNYTDFVQCAHETAEEVLHAAPSTVHLPPCTLRPYPYQPCLETIIGLFCYFLLYNCLPRHC